MASSVQHADLSEGILKKLKSGKDILAPKQIFNKHIFQLSQLKRKGATSSNKDALRWMRCLIPSFSADITEKNLDRQWKRLLNERESYRKNGLLDEWNLRPYIPPNVLGQRSTEKNDSVDTVSKREYLILDDVNKQLAKEVAQLKEERQSPSKTKNAERREKRHSENIKELRSEKKHLSTENESLTEKLEKNKLAVKRLSSESSRLKSKVARLQCDAKENEQCEGCHVLSDKLKNILEENKKLREVNANLIDRIKELESDSVQLCDETGAYLPKVNKCVWDILDCNVAHSQVAPVMKATFQLCKKTCNSLPCESTVRNMDKQRLLVAQKQLCDIQDKMNTSLQTDETPKYGEKYCAYVLDDEEKNSYLLGMRHMSDKSALTTLETFQEILEDLNYSCTLAQKSEKSEAPGHKLLCNIASTMSDRAATEVKFNTLLEEYRKEFLPLYKGDAFNDLTEEEKASASKLHNFFCGLHLLVGMADTASAALLAHEQLHFSSEEDLDDENEKNHGESGTI
ncbi:uncharacterized protein LOC112139279, partial [Oryzias melastigma]|uniref:uncharacterized protein LOC112139279 n=1 Tax=Oryzias melastigma TaxID=30732 RepID=UPI000CF7B8D9